MKHRSYRGQMVYLTNGVGEMGREYFSVTVQPDGMRTLRAQCEMDDDRLLRDVVLTVDSAWHPVDGFVRLVVEEQLVGSSWFAFGRQYAEFQGRLAGAGRVSRQVPTTEPIEYFGTHALHGDAWVVGRLRRWRGAMEDFPLATFATSTLANGGSGPELLRLGRGYSRIEDLGIERIEVAAGSFETRHIRVLVPGVDDFDVWAGGEDCLPVRLTSDVLGQTYELVKVEGDWR